MIVFAVAIAFVMFIVVPGIKFTAYILNGQYRQDKEAGIFSK